QPPEVGVVAVAVPPYVALCDASALSSAPGTDALALALASTPFSDTPTLPLAVALPPQPTSADSTMSEANIPEISIFDISRFLVDEGNGPRLSIRRPALLFSPAPPPPQTSATAGPMIADVGCRAH